MDVLYKRRREEVKEFPYLKPTIKKQRKKDIALMTLVEEKVEETS